MPVLPSTPMSVVLIVENDADLLGALSEGLADQGWTVLGATSVRGALEVAQTRHVDVVLSDLGLADGDGEALAGTLGATLPLVFMTGSSLRGRELHGLSVVTKPFDVPEVAAILAQALSQRSEPGHSVVT